MMKSILKHIQKCLFVKIVSKSILKIQDNILPYILKPGINKKGKGFPYSLPSVGPVAHPGVQAVSPQVI